MREDYSSDGDAWNYLPFEQSRSRAYRWSEDGMAGICDVKQHLCFAFAFWNGVDPFLKERPFGLSNGQGNHGEDVKDYWWYLDSTPTHSWMRWRYHYPQRRFPYEELVQENARRSRNDPEFELLDTGVFEGGYWIIEVSYAKAAPDDICIEVSVRNAGSAAATLHLLPTLWFRNRWAWNPNVNKPSLHAESRDLIADDPVLGRRHLVSDGTPDLLFCDNETNMVRCFRGGKSASQYPKDGINDHVVNDAATVNPNGTGTKAAFWHRLTVAAGATATVRLRLSDAAGAGLSSGFSAVMTQRAAEADAFYAALSSANVDSDSQAIMRQAFAGLLWGKQFYHFDVARWFDGDPGQPAPPTGRDSIRNGAWRHLNTEDVISMPDKWEYPWFAAWDLGFHCATLAYVDPEFAKQQLILICREWLMHANGQLPAYEWNFSDVNPPVHAWAARRIFEIDGSRDFDFLERIFHKLLINFTWWVNRKDSLGNDVFEGGFLGLDNIGVFNRSTLPPGAGQLEQSDATAWMAMYCLDLLKIALTLAHHDSTYEDVATKFFEHFARIAVAMDNQGLWNAEDGYYYDILHLDAGSRLPVKAHSIVGLIALCGTTVVDSKVTSALPGFTERMLWFLENKTEFARVVSQSRDYGQGERRLFAIVDPDRLRQILARAFDENELLSPYGLRSVSAWHRDHPLVMNVNGVESRLDYEPAESTTGLYGGNSNWRGPIWFPVNHLVIEALRRFQHFLGDDYKVEYPTRSGKMLTLDQIADDLEGRLISIFTSSANGSRPVFGGNAKFQTDPEWRDLIPFHEYFHGDNGAGLGASHQTGWTALVAGYIARQG